MAGVDVGASTPSPLILVGTTEPGGARLFFSVEVVDDGEDEAADRADKLNPIQEIHPRHLLPSRKEADTSNCLPRRIYHSFIKISSRNKLI